MAVPGFTAEASLYRSTQAYARTSWTPSTRSTTEASPVFPALFLGNLPTVPILRYWGSPAYGACMFVCEANGNDDVWCAGHCAPYYGL
jgi:hypothetical protein